MTGTRVADYLVTRCVEIGVRHVFIVTGGGAMFLNDAFARNKEISVICFHHEQAAAMAAEAYYRASGLPVVVNVTTGPGGINALNGVYGAFVDSQAMIVVSGQVKSETLNDYAASPLRQLGDQEVDIVSLARPVSKYVVSLRGKDEIGMALDRALFFASHGRPGPVWIDIPVDIQGALIDSKEVKRCADPRHVDELLPQEFIHPNTRLELESRRACLDEEIEAIFARLSAASRPVILLGSGLRHSGVIGALLKFAADYHLPVVSAWNAHDLVPDEHPCFVGRPGTVGDRAGNFVVQASDFLLVLGCRLNIRQISYNFRSFARDAFIAMVDIDRAELDKPTLKISKKIHADLRHFVPKLIEVAHASKTGRSHIEFLDRCRVIFKQYSHRYERLSDSESINPYQFLRNLFENLGHNDIVVTGNGAACVMSFQVASIKNGQRLFTNSGAASMGYDLPAAIGASLSKGGGRVICIAGDGSIMMNLQELQTIRTLRLPIKVIVLDNGGYLSIDQTQSSFFPDNKFGTGFDADLEFPDFSYVAEAFGLRSKKITTLSTWNEVVLSELFLGPEPSLFHVVVDPSQQFTPKLASRRNSDGLLISPDLDDMSPPLDSDTVRSVRCFLRE